MRSLSPLCALALLASLAWIGSGCAGGCGEEPPSSSEVSDGGTGRSSGSGQGAGEVDGSGASPENAKDGADRPRSGFDTARKGAKRKSGAEKAGELAGEDGEPATKRRGLRDLPASELSSTLGRTPISRRTLVFERTPDCEACDLAEPAVAQVALEKDEFDFYRVDLGDVQLTTSTTLPIFLMYKGGAQTSRLAGLPFKRETRVDGGVEEAASYQKRLRRWLRDALTQRNLNFAKR